MTKNLRCLVKLVSFSLAFIFILSFQFGDYIAVQKIANNWTNSTRAKRLPNALIIGVRKGGTRALLDAIGLHPSVRIVHHEIHYFDANFSKGIEWYMEQMPFVNSENDVVIEKTPAYFTNNDTPKRVFELNPNMKIILIVRHPVYRAISDFTQVYYNKWEQNKTLPVWTIEAFHTDAHGHETINMDYKPVTNSLYFMHMRKWLKYFPLSNFHIVNGDVFRENPLKELKQLESFLEIEHLIRADQLVFNKKKGFYCFRKTDKVKCLGESKGRRHRPISRHMIRKLADVFKEPNQIFFEQIKQSFNWDFQ